MWYHGENKSSSVLAIDRRRGDIGFKSIIYNERPLASLTTASSLQSLPLPRGTRPLFFS